MHSCDRPKLPVCAALAVPCRGGAVSIDVHGTRGMPSNGIATRCRDGGAGRLLVNCLEMSPRGFGWEKPARLGGAKGDYCRDTRRFAIPAVGVVVRYFSPQRSPNTCTCPGECWRRTRSCQSPLKRTRHRRVPWKTQRPGSVTGAAAGRRGQAFTSPWQHPQRLWLPFPVQQTVPRWAWRPVPLLPESI